MNDKPLKPLNVTPVDRQVVCARLSPDGAILAAGTIEGVVHRWKFGEKQLDAMPPIKGHHAWVTSVVFHPKEPRMFTTDSWGQLRAQSFADDAPQTAWQLDTAHDGWIRQMAISPDGAHLATCGRDQFVRIWTPDGKMVSEHRHTDDVLVIIFSPDGKEVIFGDLFCKLHVLDFAAKKVVRTIDGTTFYKLDRIQDISGIRMLAFYGEGKLLLAAGCLPDNGGTIQGTPMLMAFDYATGQMKHKFMYGAIKDGFIEDIAIHPEGHIMAVTSGSPGTGRFLQFRFEEKEAFDSATQLPNCQAIALHPDGRRFVIASTNRDSAGNGRRTDKEGGYPANTSPLNLFELPPKA